MYPIEIVAPMKQELTNQGFQELLSATDVEQSINKGDVILFASVGAGMNINAIVYKM